MKCPKCQWTGLKIKRAAGLESLLLLFISLRKYTCASCGHSFRAPDRREVHREEIAPGEAPGSYTIPTR